MHRENPEPLRFLWGGHNLQTRFSHFGVRAGDTVYPVMIAQRRPYLVGRMTVASVADLSEYLQDHSRDRAYVYHRCATEALIGAHGSFLHFDLSVPSNVLERWRFSASRGERPIRGLIEGELTIPMTFQGTYRLSEATATDLFDLLLDHEAKKQLQTRRDLRNPWPS
ncbi:MAG: hypothetical protein JO036_06455 [Candidatus Eremiobacteraeota bacterium]|nr:hypothetical protein [Candidatus Eremiobacteraeota bacterium]